jgi:hypothetical protein
MDPLEKSTHEKILFHVFHHGWAVHQYATVPWKTYPNVATSLVSGNL